MPFLLKELRRLQEFLTETARRLRGDCTVSVQIPGYRQILPQQSSAKQREEARSGASESEKFTPNKCAMHDRTTLR